jgi:hypothetical protein
MQKRVKSAWSSLLLGRTRALCLHMSEVLEQVTGCPKEPRETYNETKKEMMRCDDWATDWAA